MLPNIVLTEKKHISVEAGEDNGARIFLRNGDQLHGTLISGTAGEVVWQHPDFSAPLAFEVANVKRLVFPKPSAPAPGSKGKCTVKCLNGDWLSGKVISLDEATLHFESEGGILWHLPRPELEWVYFDDRQAPSYLELCDHLQGWEAVGPWRHSAETNMFQGGIILGREMGPLPDHLECTFEAMLGVNDTFTLSLFVKSALSPSLEPGALSITGTWKTLGLSLNNGHDTPTQDYSFGSPGSSSHWFQQIIEYLQEYCVNHDLPAFLGAPPPVKMKWTVLYQRSTGRIEVYRDNEKLAAHEFQKRGAGAKGNNFSLQLYGSDAKSVLAVSRLRMRPWNGLAPGQSVDQQALRLNGGAVKHGSILGIAADRIKFQPSAGGVEMIPVGQARFLSFAGETAHAPPDTPTSRLVLAQGGEVAGTVTAWDADKLLCKTSWGEVTLPVALVKEWTTSGEIVAPPLFHEENDRVYFANQDQFSGRLDVTPDMDALRWKTKAQPAGLTISSARATEIRLHDNMSLPTASPLGMIRLKNGDFLPGNVTEWDARHCLVAGSSKDKIHLPNELISAVYFPSNSGKNWDHFSPEASNGWKAYQFSQYEMATAEDDKFITPDWSRWKWKGGRLTLPSNHDGLSANFQGVGRKKQLLPESFETELTVLDNAEVGFCLVGEGATSPPYVQFSPSTQSVNLLLESDQNQTDINLSAYFKKDRPSNQHHVRFYVHRRTGHIQFFLNGKLAAEWTKTALAKLLKKPAAVVLWSYDSDPSGAHPLQMQDLWFGPSWMEHGREKTFVPEQEDMMILLGNGDEISGKLQQKSSGPIHLQTAIGPVELPAARIQMIRPAQAKPSEGENPLAAPQPGAAPIKVLLKNQGSISVEKFAAAADGLHVLAFRQNLVFPWTEVREIVLKP